MFSIQKWPDGSPYRSKGCGAIRQRLVSPAQCLDYRMAIALRHHRLQHYATESTRIRSAAKRACTALTKFSIGRRPFELPEDRAECNCKGQTRVRIQVH